MAEEQPTRYWGMLAEFETPAALYHACEHVRDSGFTRWDAYTPFPVHGLDEAMGLSRSRLPWIVLGGGLTGAGGAFALQSWVHAVEYPLIISGKPFIAWPAFIPVTFELGVLLASLSALVGLLGLTGLPRFHHPVFESDRFEAATNDRFFIAIETADPKYDHEETRRLFQELGASYVEAVPEPGSGSTGQNQAEEA